MAEWFGASWSTLGFVVITALAMYVTMLVAIRLAGRRTVAQLSAYDVIVTVALGTLLSSTMVAPQPSYAQATVGVVTLLGVQVLVGALRRRSELMRRLLEFEPEVVIRDGEVQLPRGLQTSQLSHGELRSRLRQHGIFTDEPLALVVLEPSGHVSVTRQAPDEVRGEIRLDGED